jgi:hypothetical protein
MNKSNTQKVSVDAQVQKNGPQVSGADPQDQAARKLPGFPCVRVRADGSAFVVRELVPGRDGLVRVTRDGRAICDTLKRLHRAAWPELWPVAAGPSDRVEVADPVEEERRRLAPAAGEADIPLRLPRSGRGRSVVPHLRQPVQDSPPAETPPRAEESSHVSDEQIKATVERFAREKRLR